MLIAKAPVFPGFFFFGSSGPVFPKTPLCRSKHHCILPRHNCMIKENARQTSRFTVHALNLCELIADTSLFFL